MDKNQTEPTELDLAIRSSTLIQRANKYQLKLIELKWKGKDHGKNFNTYVTRKERFEVKDLGWENLFSDLPFALYMSQSHLYFIFSISFPPIVLHFSFYLPLHLNKT